MRRRLITAYVISILGFIAGLSLLALGELAAAGLYGSEEVAIRRGYLIPYLPSVYVPVVAAHATFSLVARPTIRKTVSVVLVVLGSIYLLGLGILALTAQTFLFASQTFFVLSLAGPASPGYFLVALGWILDALGRPAALGESESTPG